MVPLEQSTAELVQDGINCTFEIVRTGLEVDSGGVELLLTPSAAGNVWPTVVSGKLGAEVTKMNASAERGAYTIITRTTTVQMFMRGP